MMIFGVSCPMWMVVGVCIVSMLALYRLGVPLEWSIIGHAVGLSVLSGGVDFLGRCLTLTFWQPQSLLLFGVIAMMMLFVSTLEATGLLQGAIGGLRRAVPDGRWLHMALPALVGLLPVPGGALFSAPLVNAVDSAGQLSAAHKTAINYWFRHIWEYWWPLYPGVVLALLYSGLPVWLYMLVMFPFTLLAVWSGWFFILRTAGRYNQGTHGSTEAGGRREVIRGIAPILVCIGLSLVVAITLKSTGIAEKEANLWGLLGSQFCISTLLLLRTRTVIASVVRKAVSGKTAVIMLTVVGIQLFAVVLQAPLAQTSIVQILRTEFHAMGIPLVAIICIVPFFAGVATGVAFGFVGTSFPIIFGLLGDAPSLNQVVAATVAGYSMGYVGMMASPLHLCLIVTNKYFKTALIRVYPFLLKPLLTVAAGGVALGTGYYYLFKLFR